jgi:DNA-binding response OmpR family regulator
VPKVLLVEDHEDTRLMYAEFLGDDFEVIQASDGEGALEAMRARVPDLVITDVSLPGVDGFELINRMRRETSLARVPVICLSGYSTDALEEPRVSFRSPAFRTRSPSPSPDCCRTTAARDQRG